jgi:hypothetical protein
MNYESTIARIHPLDLSIKKMRATNINTVACKIMCEMASFEDADVSKND